MKEMKRFIVEMFVKVVTSKGVWAALAFLALMYMLITGNDEGGLLAMALVTGVDGGKHVVNGPLTLDAVQESGNGLLLNEIDKQIVKIRPMATPIDQLSRCAGAKSSGSMVVDYYNVDTKETCTETVDDYDEPNANTVTENDMRAVINTMNNDVFDVSDTILVPEVYGYDERGVNETSDSLVLYVMSKNEDGTLVVMAANGKKVGDVEGCVPSIPVGTKLIRMGRAATELDVQSPQFEAMPKKAQNHCQIFKMQIEQSTLQKIANKEVGWTMSDQEEAAIDDMRLGMEKSFLFGVKRKIYDFKKKEWVLLTGGVWHQAGKDFVLDIAKKEEAVIDMMRNAFTGNAGSKRKILIGGSQLIGELNKLSFTRVVANTETTTKWGIDFSEISSKFGRLYVLLSEVFDDCGMDGCGLIIDPDYIQKYSHLPFGTEALDLKSAGVRNTDALVITEASCLVLRYPKAHMRVKLG
ncbi:MAG: hypothetical protein IIU72_02250 [Muribaculaceae bacterium]|nr:hypothetical protein [Muribaculaceae bacterium]